MSAFWQMPLVERMGWVLVHSLWQGAAIGLLCALVLLVLRGASPNARYLAACAALALTAAAPVATFFAWPPKPVAIASPREIVTPVAPRLADAAVSPQPAAERTVPPAMRAETPARADVQPPTAPPITPPWHLLSASVSQASPWLVAGWIAGVLVLSVRLMAGWIQVQSMKQRRTASVAVEWEQRLGELARKVGVSGPVRLLTSTLAESPLVIGWLAPVVLLPASLLTGLAPQQLEALLAHELAHIRRHDYLVNLFQSALETVLFYHPVVWWLGARIRDERENACDDLAIEACGDRLVYARALTFIEERRGRSGELAPAASGGALLLRIRRLLGLRPRVERFTAVWGASLLTACLAMATVAAALLPARAADEKPAAQSISGHVADPAGRNVAQARVTLVRQSLWSAELKEIGTCASDNAGRFKLDLPRSDKGDWRERMFVVWIEAPGFAPKAAIHWEPAPAPLEIALEQPVSFDVRALDEAGAPLAGVRVQPGLFVFEKPIMFHQPPPALAERLTQTTDAQGVAHFTNLPPGARTNLKIADSRFASLTNREQTITPQRGQSEPHTVTLIAGGKIRGRVRDAATGRPAPGLTAIAQGMLSGMPAGRAITDAEGRYEITQLRPGPHNVRVHLYGELAKTWAAREVENVAVVANKTVEAVNLELITGAVIAGRVTAEDSGEPVPDVIISFDDTDRYRYGSAMHAARTDRDGRYSIRVVPDQRTYLIMAQPPAEFLMPTGPRPNASVPAGQTQTFDFKLPRRPAGHTVKLRAVDAEGRVIPSLELYAETSSLDHSWYAFEQNPRGELERAVDDFSKQVKVRARRGEDATAEPVAIAEGGELTVKLVPDILGRLRGKVLDPGGRSIGGVKLTLMEWNGARGSGEEVAVTKQDGSFEIPRIWPGATVSVKTEAARWINGSTERITFQRGETRELPPLILQPAMRQLGGRVVDEKGAPVPRIGVALQGEHSARQETVTGADGRFRFAGLADEQVRLVAGEYGELTGTAETEAGADVEIVATRPPGEGGTVVIPPQVAPEPAAPAPIPFAKLPEAAKSKLVMELFDKGEFFQPARKEIVRDLLSTQSRYCGMNGPGFTMSAIALAQKEGWNEMIPLVEAIYQQPTSLHLFEAAFAYRRTVSGSPPPPEIMKAVETLVQAGWFRTRVTDEELSEHTKVLKSHADKEAVLVAAIRGAGSSRGKGGTERGLNALVEVLKNLDPAQVRPRLETLRLEVLFGEASEVETLMQKLGFSIKEARHSLWGEAVEGVQAALQATYPDWWRSEQPVLKLSLRNQGRQSPYVARQPEVVEVEVDGAWYAWNGPVSVTSGPLAPGERIDDIVIALDSTKWHSKEKLAPLALAPGAHRIRVSMPIEGKAGPAPRAISNTLSLNVLAIDPPPPPAGGQWSRPEGGLILAAAPSKPFFAVGDNVVVVFTFRNVSDHPIEHLDAEDKTRAHYHQFMFSGDEGQEIAQEPPAERDDNAKLVRTTIPPGESIERIVPLGPWKLAGLGHPYTAIGAEARSFRVTAIYRTPEGEDVKGDHIWRGSITAPPVKIEIRPKEAARIKSPPLSTDNSPAAVAAAKARGTTSAQADIAAGKPAIVYYGKPWSQGKPLVDDETGLPVEIAAEAGCEVTACFEAEAAAYNEAIRKWHAASATTQPAIAWGEARNGLRAGLSYDMASGPFKAGDHVRLRFAVGNVSETPIALTYFQPNSFADGLRLKDSAGRAVVLSIPAQDHPVVPASITLKPGEKQAIGAADFVIRPAGVRAKEQDPIFSTGPGKYQLSDQRHFAKSKEGDWVGQLTTGTLDMTIVDEAKSDGAALLEKAKSAPDPEKRWQAIRELDEIHYQPAVKFLTESLRDPDALVRANAARALSSLEVPSPNPLWPALERETDGGALQQMALGLSKMGCWEALPQLRKAAAHPDEQTRIWVLQAIGVLGDDGDVAFLAGYLDDKSNSVVAMAAEALQQITKADFGFPARQGPVNLEAPLAKARAWWKEQRAKFQPLDNQAEVHVTAQLSGAAYEEALAADKSGTDRRRKAGAQDDPGLMRGKLKPYEEGTLHFGHQQFYITKILPEEPMQRQLKTPFVTPSEFESETLGATITLKVQRRLGRILFAGKCEIPRLETETPMKTSREVVASSTVTRQARFTGVADLAKPVIIDLGEKTGTSRLTLTFSAAPLK